MSRPSILAVTSELPWPLNTGGHLRTYHLLRQLAREFRVRLVAGVDARLDAGAVESAGISVRPVVLPARTRAGEALRIAAAGARVEPYVLYRRHARPEMLAAVAAEIAIERPNVIYMDHLDSFQFVGLGGHAVSVLDLHNVYSLLVRREAAEASRGWIARAYLAREARLLERVEARAVKRADAVFAVSQQEQLRYAALRSGPVDLVPNGVDVEAFAALPAGRLSAPPNILFIGTLSWPPNAAAARFLALDVLPAIRTIRSDATLTIVGRQPGAEVLALAREPGVTVAASVPDIVPYLRDACVMAVPLEVGGGTRLKILEAFAAGLPVVSTAVGCEGIAASDGRELVVTSRPQFASAIASLINGRHVGADLACGARALVRDEYDWPAIGRAAGTAIQRVLRSRSANQGAFADSVVHRR